MTPALRSSLPRLPIFYATSNLESSLYGCILEFDRTADPYTVQALNIAAVRRPFIWKEHLMTAKILLQRYLDDMTYFVMRERFEDYCSRIELPLSIITSNANIRVSSVADLEEGFDDFTDMIQTMGVTDMLRSVNAATYIGNDLIVGVYETRLMNQNKLALPIFHSKMWIRCYDGIWKAIRIHNTTKDGRWPILLTRLAAEPLPPEEL